MQVSPIEIRRARQADADEVYGLADQLDSAVEVDQEAFQRAYPAVLADEHSYCAVAMAEGQVQGYASGHLHPALYVGGTKAFLDEMVVAEELRHSGLGRRLVEAFEQWARDQGCGQVELAAAEAAPFYESLGYQSRAGYYVKRLD